MTVHSLLGYALTVPDLEAGRRFYRDFGLVPRVDRDRLVMGCAAGDADPVSLTPGSGRRLHYVRFGVAPSEQAALRRRIEAAGARIVDPPQSESNAAFAVRDPDDNLIVVTPCEKAKFLDRRREMADREAAHLHRTGGRGCPPRDMIVQPWRLGHILLFTPDVDRQIAFYSHALGMRLSDRSGEIIAFLRTAGGSDHHVVAFAKSDRPGYHHASFEVGGVDQVGFGAANLLHKGWKNGWGFGRHVIGSNYFHYVRDPWNSLAEYFFDIDYIADDAQWQARDWPADDSLYLWGPDVPADFVQNFDAPAR